MPGILLKGTLMKGDTIAKPIQDELTRELATRPRVPRILAILGTSGAPSRTYAEFTKKACVALGFDYVLYETGAAIPESGLGEGEGVKEAILKANDDPEVDGIMVYYPIFGGKEVRCSPSCAPCELLTFSQDQDLQQVSRRTKFATT
jgi:methylenetetrahydrofolate dehydrogenase (NAD+)